MTNRRFFGLAPACVFSLVLAPLGCVDPRPPAAPPSGPVVAVTAPREIARPDVGAPDPSPSDDSPCPSGGKTEGDEAVACAYAELVQKIPRKLDLDRPLEGYTGPFTAVKDAFDGDSVEARTRADEFEPLAGRTETLRWAILSRIRQASLFDAIRTKLEDAEPPRVELFTDKERKLLDKATASGEPALVSMAENLRSQRVEMYKNARERWLASVEEPMILHYAEALLLAKGFTVESLEMGRARARFAHYEELLGEQKIAQYTQRLSDPASKQPFVYKRGSLDR
jgi:hypothetical protein